jgi:intron-binding protein aquarius
MEQSLFTRFIRLGVPFVQLDAQGRARAEIAALYNWRYKALGDLPHILTADEFLQANPGFQYNFQFVDVPDFNGVGESTPSPYFYQVTLKAYNIISFFRILAKPNMQLLFSLICESWGIQPSTSLFSLPTTDNVR